MKTITVRYSVLEQALHWTTAILVLIAFTYGPGGAEQRVYSAAVDFDRRLHETLGLCVLTLTAVRLAWRFFDIRPDPPQEPRWMELHGWLGDAILWLAGLHALAALFHHFVLRDGVMRSMLPGPRG